MNLHPAHILSILAKEYKNPVGFLNYRNSFELLISVILSAQTTDRQVNEISNKLFACYPDAGALAAARQSHVEEIIHSTGFYRQKAKNIIACAQRLVENFNSEVPATMEALVSLAGVGRKSASVVLGAVYGKPVIIVDTHFKRVCTRLGLTHSSNPEKIEIELKEIVPEEIQYDFSMLINRHGREYCKAKKPDCVHCPLRNICPQAEI
jgi:endonuclease-3